jgi:uncharacterized DUF497 family protein
MTVKITYDPVKRQKTLQERGLDFARAPEVFAKRHTVEAVEVHGEKRFFTMGVLNSTVVVIVRM